MWYNKNKDYVWIKYHFLTDQGIDNYTQEEADKIAGMDPDTSVKDLYNNIACSNFPSWRVYVQIMDKEAATKYRFDPFDVTKVWYHKDYPLVPLGKMVLNRNPENFFAEIEQLAFSPSHFVPGIGPSPDKLLQGRLMSYPDAHRHRIGANVNQLKVNESKNAPVHNYQKDGNMSINGNMNTKLNYFPNTYENIDVDPKMKSPEVPVNGSVARHTYPDSDLDFEQAGELYRRVMSEEQKNQLILNISNSLKLAQPKLQYRMTALFYKADSGYGTRVADKLDLNVNDVITLSKMSQKERVKATY